MDLTKQDIAYIKANSSAWFRLQCYYLEREEREAMQFADDICKKEAKRI